MPSQPERAVECYKILPADQAPPDGKLYRMSSGRLLIGGRHSDLVRECEQAGIRVVVENEGVPLEYLDLLQIVAPEKPPIIPLDTNTTQTRWNGYFSWLK